jgi:hypothetical protein
MALAVLAMGVSSCGPDGSGGPLDSSPATWTLEGVSPLFSEISWNDGSASGRAALTVNPPARIVDGKDYTIDALYVATKTQKEFPEQLGVEIGIIDRADPFFVVQPQVVTIPKGQSLGPVTAEVRSTPVWEPSEEHVKNRTTIEIEVSGGVTGHPNSIIRRIVKYTKQ